MTDTDTDSKKYSLGAAYQPPCDPQHDVAELEKWVSEYTIQLEGKKLQLAELKKLLGEIDGAVEQYRGGYDDLAQNKDKAECFKNGKQDEVEKRLDDPTRCEIDECIKKADEAIERKRKALKDAEDDLSSATGSLADTEQALKSVAEAFTTDKTRAALLKAKFAKQLTPLGEEINKAGCDYCRVYFLLSGYVGIWDAIDASLVSVDDYRQELYDTWCKVRDAQLKVTEAKVELARKTKGVANAKKALEDAVAARSEAIIECVRKIGACTDPSIPDPTKQAQAAP